MNRIKELREKHGMSQSAIAKIAHVHQTAVSQWEKGRTSPDIDSALSLCEYFDVSLDYLLGRTNNRIDDVILDKVLTVDQDFLELAGNLHDAQIIQKKFDEKIRQFKEVVQKTELSPQDEGIALYKQLDEIDKAEIRGEMRQMLKNDKYNQETAKMA